MSSNTNQTQLINDLKRKLDELAGIRDLSYIKTLLDTNPGAPKIIDKIFSNMLWHQGEQSERALDILERYKLLIPNSDTENKQLYEKLQPYKLFEPNYLAVGNDVTLELKYGEKTRMSKEEYNKKLKEGINLLDDASVNVAPFLVNRTASTGVGYLFNGTEKMELDDIDKKFLKEFETFRYRTFYGLHSYGGYCRFFRPDLAEVMELIGSSVGDLDKIERIYVTTNMHPSEDMSQCLDTVIDRHLAKTSIYIVYKEDYEMV